MSREEELAELLYKKQLEGMQNHICDFSMGFGIQPFEVEVGGKVGDDPPAAYAQRCIDRMKQFPTRRPVRPVSQNELAAYQLEKSRPMLPLQAEIDTFIAENRFQASPTLKKNWRADQTQQQRQFGQLMYDFGYLDETNP